ncbi:helix-turn-helix transcriptional regulator [Streptomyces sp. CHA1]|uniref:helix-turn-helix domain-containing protein n=1 Tax=Streptomyces TaxID=1883 RepID=UPI00101E31DB|nr:MULTISPECIES: helix-turn-helix transcriptional regulator [Streptomyces]MBT3157384.1 helix-turn-helix transcriptional regulator [Streptomyces sp. G11C]MCO6700291.1 helix-turn-helix transcriptional regulator [Streptomyces sp. CHB9.2]MCO6706426.1 helix-turn-helix transcriptional regulator [Streptomyces sp. CHA3]MCO6712169.1 helix-turn-helix transcriptional regulator [Streptomyces sp. CHB19.2]MCO6718603.1 helix-turn-helix transcriptional regulator [Streptomyces sp. Vc714c-19]
MKNSNRGTTHAHADASTGSAEFGRWLTGRLESLGYNLSGPRSGGRSAFADRSGISPSTVTRLLRGEMPTDTRILRTLAEAIDVPYPEVLVRAGVLTPDELAAVQRPTAPPGGITPEQAADQLGITDPAERRVFVNMAQTLRRTTNGEQQLAD